MPWLCCWIVTLLVGGLGAVGCDPETDRPERAEGYNVLYDLSGEGSGRSYGTLRITSDGSTGEVCWDVTVETLPKALQLHQDVTGPFDPVVRSLYEPPARPAAVGCAPLDRRTAAEARDDPSRFYVDGHNSDRSRTPSLWAALTPRSE